MTLSRGRTGFRHKANGLFHSCASMEATSGSGGAVSSSTMLTWFSSAPDRSCSDAGMEGLGRWVACDSKRLELKLKGRGLGLRLHGLSLRGLDRSFVLVVAVARNVCL